LQYVVDSSNYSDEYSRNFLRLNVIPKIKERFADVENAISRFVDVLSEEDEFLSRLAKNAVVINEGKVAVLCNEENPVFARACVIAMKECGIVKDYDKAHIDGLLALKIAQNGKKISLLNGVVGVKEYDRVAFYKQVDFGVKEQDFYLGEFNFGNAIIAIETCFKGVDIKNKKSCELYFDLDKIPSGAVLRTRKDSDVFTKFGGGTKNLGDYMTDKKIPLLERDLIPIVAKDNVVLIVCGKEISNLIKIDENTTRIAKITIK
jgi:tRNA(Ile)-lysidine synthase